MVKTTQRYQWGSTWFWGVHKDSSQARPSPESGNLVVVNQVSAKVSACLGSVAHWGNDTVLVWLESEPYSMITTVADDKITDQIFPSISTTKLGLTWGRNQRLD